MKVGIITIQKAQYNYGAVFQCYALWKYISSLGFDCQVIDLHRAEHKDFIESKTYRPFIHKNGLKFYYNTIKRFISRSYYKRAIRSYTPSVDAFNKFNDTIKYSKPYRGVDNLYNDPPLYDIYITGSDQVWNPTQKYCLEPYFLTFVKDKLAKKLSYAPSIGIERLNFREKCKFSRWLKTYDAISLREEASAQLIREITGKNVCTVPDPTFLLDIKDWKDLSIKPKYSNYIFLYVLSGSAALISYAVKLSKESGKQLIIVSDVNLPASVDYIVDSSAGPREFLGYLSHADLVLSNSFHCSLFSIILESKNFFTYLPPNYSRGVRMIELLNGFSLSKHIIRDLEHTFSRLKEVVDIDRNTIETTFSKQQKIGRDFLISNLKS